MKRLILVGMLCMSLPACAYAQTAWPQEQGYAYPHHTTQPSEVYLSTSMPDVDRSDYWLDFDELDRNRDGRLSRDEIQSAHPAGRTSSTALANLLREFHVADRNGDGYLERSEIPGWL